MCLSLLLCISTGQAGCIFYNEHVQDRCQKFAFLKLSRSACHEFGFQNYFRLISWNVASLEMSRISRIWTCSLISTWINRFGSPFLLPSSNFPALRSRFPNTGFKKWFISDFHIINLVWEVSSNQLFGLRIPVFRPNSLSKIPCRFLTILHCLLRSVIPCKLWNFAPDLLQLVYPTRAVKPLKRLIFSSYVDMGSWG